ncbi:MAG: HNH endonuclease signature motif containing protein [Oligoflexia bacterium]|nr:HNH endonuclease signature motif containing protein [Oligoflexia bacterium]
MMNFKSVSDSALLEKTKTLVQEERKLTTSVLWHLHEIQKRRLYAEQGFQSLFDYCVRGLNYSEAAAGRRIAAMRLLVDVPEAEPLLEAGAISLSTLSTIQGFVQRKDAPTSKAEKMELVAALQGKSRRECEQHLVALGPEAARPADRERVISPTETEIRFVADDALMEKLKRIRELDAHVNSDPSYLDLFHRLADLALKKLDPEKRIERKSTPPAESPQIPEAPSTNPRYVPAAVKGLVWKRDQGCCTYRTPEGRRCSSRFALEIDHIKPLAHGGLSTPENLRLLCRAHNRQQALAKLGPEVMRPYLV